MNSDEQTQLSKRLKELLEHDKRKEAARLIETASEQLLGDDHFAYNGHNSVAQTLAVIDMSQFEKFVERLRTIRTELDTSYIETCKRLGEVK